MSAQPPTSSGQVAAFGILAKAGLFVRVWLLAVRIRVELWRRPLPEVVARLDTPTLVTRHPTRRLVRAVNRGLRIGSWRPRCLLRSLVLYRLLRAQGDAPTLIIGLPSRATETDAHSWVELDGRDVGPYPGRFGHEELARFPRTRPGEGPTR